MSAIRLLWSLFETDSKRRFLILLGLTTFAGFVEVASVGLVIPFIAVAADALPFGRASEFTQFIRQGLISAGWPEKYSTAGLGLVFLGGVTVANAYLCLYQYYAARVVQLQRLEFSKKIMKNLSSQSIEWLEKHNSADLIRVAITDAGNACTLINAVTQVAAVATRCAVVYVFFLATQFRLAVALAISLLFLYQIIFKTVKASIQHAGTLAQSTHNEMVRSASELIGGSRAVLSTATEEKFYRRFSAAAEAAVWPQVVRTLPNYVTRAGLETATVFLVISLLIYFNAKDGNLANGLPLLSAYAVAGIRLLPAVQQCITYILEIKFCTPSLQEVARLIRQTPQWNCGNGSTLPPTWDSLHLNKITYSFDETPVLKDISLTIRRNQRVAFVGETGAGKSTLVDVILGLRIPQRGHLAVDHTPITYSNAKDWRARIGYVPQSIYLIDGSVAENIAFGSSAIEIDAARLIRSCEMASILSLVEQLPQGFSSFVGERGVRLSGGQCQRIGIARALYNQPAVVVFDEATSALDSHTENSILEALDALKGEKTLIVIAHRLNTVWDFDQIFVLDRGCLVNQGTAKQLLETCPIFARLAQHQIALLPGQP